jgi:hypothetical protein
MRLGTRDDQETTRANSTKHAAVSASRIVGWSQYQIRFAIEAIP